MIALDLFARNDLFTSAAKKFGYEVYGTYHEQFYNVNQVCNFLDFSMDKLIKELGSKPDVIWASPPCNTFSLLSVGHHWNKDKTPKSDQCKKALKMIDKIIKIIEDYEIKFWFIENPRAFLRKQSIMENLPRKTVTYCSYGDDRMKPTDIWTNLNWMPREMCFNNNPNCNHLRAPKGSAGGTLSLKQNKRALIPTALFDDIFETIEINIKEPNKVFKGQQIKLNI